MKTSAAFVALAALVAGTSAQNTCPAGGSQYQGYCCIGRLEILGNNQPTASVGNPGSGMSSVFASEASAVASSGVAEGSSLSSYYASYASGVASSGAAVGSSDGALFTSVFGPQKRAQPTGTTPLADGVTCFGSAIPITASDFSAQVSSAEAATEGGSAATTTASGMTTATMAATTPAATGSSSSISSAGGAAITQAPCLMAGAAVAAFAAFAL